MSYRSSFEEGPLGHSPAENSDDSGTSDLSLDSSEFPILSPPPQRHGSHLPRPPAERLEESPGYWSSGQRAESAIVGTRIRVNFSSIIAGTPLAEDRYPFRLFDCNHFLNHGELRVQEIDNDSLRTDVDVDLRSFASMQEWEAQNPISWVAVSYDSTTRPDTEGSPMFEVEPTGFLVRHDVLKLLCIFAQKRFEVDYLWLDGLCIRQDSPSERSRWKQPGNVKRVFGCAKATVVLLNGLCQLPPSQKLGSAVAVFDPAPDFAGSLRAFLELAFARSLHDVSLLFTPFEFPLKSTELTADDLKVATMDLKDFLQECVKAGRLQLGGDLNHQSIVSINTFTPPSPPNFGAGSEYYNTHSHRRAETLLSLLISRDKLQHLHSSTNHNHVPLDWEQTAGDWEEAIWHNVLFARDAYWCGEFVFGLTWLLQDLCDALWSIEAQQRAVLGYTLLNLSQGPIICPMQQGSYPFHPAEARPRPNLVDCILRSSRGKIEDSMEDAGCRVPFVHVMLPILVDKFNEVRGPSPKVVAELQKQGWDVPFLPWWASVPMEKMNPEQEYRWDVWTHTRAPKVRATTRPVWFDLGDRLGTLHLTIDNIDPRQPAKQPHLALYLKGTTFNRPDNHVPTSHLLPRSAQAHQRRGMPIRPLEIHCWIPATKIIQLLEVSTSTELSENSQFQFVQYFELCRHHQWQDCWMVPSYYTLPIPEDKWKLWPRLGDMYSYKLYRLTPAHR